ncbi:MAG: diphthine--ammonia ligase [Actinomycetota bacterium]|nr:diphthine--ammonia ligase [Actinomycetota bacterium]MDI6822004.1 diphthine--ammonia ligase [Actinomycetota bacterium]
MKVFTSWSGGKETSLSCYKVMQKQDVKVAYLLNMISKDGKHSRSHGVSSTLLRLQARAIGIPIVQRKIAWENYEEEFKKAMSDFKKEDIRAGVFGDIDLQEHREWVERVCKEIGIRPILPLWKERREELLEEFIQVGFKAIVVATNADFLGKEWLGREINKGFIEELKALGNIDLCGEKGEYHTFVYAGPIFKNPVGFTVGEKVLEGKHWFLELVPK